MYLNDRANLGINGKKTVAKTLEGMTVIRVSLADAGLGEFPQRQSRRKQRRGKQLTA